MREKVVRFTSALVAATLVAGPVVPAPAVGSNLAGCSKAVIPPKSRH